MESTKEVNKQVNSESVYFTIYSFIKEHNKLPSLSISKQNRNKYVKVLKDANLVTKVGYATWECVADYSEEKVQRASQTSKKKIILYDTIKPHIRSHAFIFTLRIPTLKNWEKREEYLIKNSIAYERTIIGHKLFMDGKKIWLTNKSVVINDKSDYIAESAVEGKSYAIAKLMGVISHIEHILKCSFKINKRYLFRVSRQHHSDLHNELAKQYRLDHKKLYVYDHKGYWMWIDFSDSIDELETGNRVDSDKTMDNSIQPFFNGLKEVKGFTPEFVLSTMQGIQENQKVFDANMQSHIAAIQKLSLAVDELRGVFKSRLDLLKEKIHSIGDVSIYQEEIRELSEKEKADLFDWIFERFKI